MICVYGQFWNPDIVDWNPGRGKKGSLEGTGKPNPNKGTVTIDGWRQRGIYVLHNNYKTVYVGRAGSEPSTIGPRLCQHLSDRLEGRWDAFSWYGIDSINDNGKMRSSGRAQTRQMSTKDIIEAYEALAILIADPPLNRRHESLKGAVEVEASRKAIPHQSGVARKNLETSRARKRLRRLLRIKGKCCDLTQSIRPAKYVNLTCKSAGFFVSSNRFYDVRTS